MFYAKLYSVNSFKILNCLYGEILKQSNQAYMAEMVKQCIVVVVERTIKFSDCNAVNTSERVIFPAGCNIIRDTGLCIGADQVLPTSSAL